jgi:ribosomal protein S18 acetylase RimI-like enzyme
MYGMNIRPAQARDLEACLALDESFETEYVWQMETARGNGAIQLGFRTTRLPRAMRVPRNGPRDGILDHFEQGECFRVAEEDSRIAGFIDVTSDLDQRIAWVHYLVVALDLRRRGTGGQLLQEALAWAHERKMRMVMTSVSTKNYPASAFLQKHGFAFCGFNDQYYQNRDIALFFARALR